MGDSSDESRANRIHPTALIEPGVELGQGNVVGPYSIVQGPCSLGDGNWIGPHVVIGTPPEVRAATHRSWGDTSDGEGIRIGDRNVIREFTNIEQPYADATVVGNDCYIMNKAYIAHDCQIGDEVTISAAVMIGGHTSIGHHANLGFGTVIHQRLVIGPGVMTGMGSVVTRSVPPFSTVFGNPARVRKANTVGMRRAGLGQSTIDLVDASYRSGQSLEVPPELEGDFEWYDNANGR